jgi:hypothetical protein
MKWAQVAFYIYIQSFMKIDVSVEGVLRFYFSNLKYYIVGITDGKGLSSALLRLG